MKFPEITRIEPLLAAIEGADEFYVGVRDGYQYIDYKIVTSTSFPDPYEAGISDEEQTKRLLRRECRGIIFDLDGFLIRRAYPKFFNYGEKLGDEFMLDLNQPHHILTKLDGSLLAPFYIGNRLVFGTMAGDTPLVEVALSAISEADIAFSKTIIDLGYTPIFEWCTPKNRIVILYPNEEIVLTGIRHVRTGEFIDYETMVEKANEYGVKVIDTLGQMDDVESFISMARALPSELEGYVVRWSNGYQVKIKGDDYVRLHRIIGDIKSEKNIIGICLDGKIDDVLQLLPPELKAPIQNYNDDFQKIIKEKVQEAKDIAAKYSHLDRKEFAKAVLAEHGYISKLIFTAHDGAKDVEEVLRNWIEFFSGNTTRMEQNRAVINNIKWADYWGS